MMLASYREANAAAKIPGRTVPIRRMATGRQADGAPGLVVPGWRGQGAWAWAGPGRLCDQYQC